jgi:hypothetical protein
MGINYYSADKQKNVEHYIMGSFRFLYRKCCYPSTYTKVSSVTSFSQPKYRILYFNHGEWLCGYATSQFRLVAKDFSALKCYITT